MVLQPLDLPVVAGFLCHWITGLRAKMVGPLELRSRSPTLIFSVRRFSLLVLNPPTSPAAME